MSCRRLIPKAVRQRLGIKAGSRLELSESGGELRLKLAERAGKAATVEEGLGLARYKGPPISIEDMNEAVSEHVRRKWKKRA
ncbi:MAG: AbrB/MazE/SpoVT family DNA-binding domain-containing protein [Gammaproteobacteria bacterium]|nr:AbrB/MazE/SpoVT family DNA-binding domain-containing protein [Gammaproteobacteria bacterium]